MLHPLNENQVSLLNEYRESNLSIKDFVSRKGITYSSLEYIIQKEKRINESNSICLDSFIPIKIDNQNKNYSNSNNNIDVIINGFNINISINDLKELLK